MYKFKFEGKDKYGYSFSLYDESHETLNEMSKYIMEHLKGFEKYSVEVVKNHKDDEENE